MRSHTLVAVASLAFMALSGTAYASIMATATTASLPDFYLAPTSVMGNVVQGVDGTTANYKSPFSDDTSRYVAVENAGTAEYGFTGPYNAISFVWGTPDPFNTVYLYNGNNQVGSISGSAIGSGSGAGSFFVTLTSTLSFNRVDFQSSGTSFEFASVSPSTVPIPATLPMFAAGLLAFAALGLTMNRGKQSSIAV